MRLFRKKKSQLEKFRSSHDWENMEHRYYRDLDLLDIMHSIESFKQKRTISKTVAKELGQYSKAYVDRNSKLLRLDKESAKPDETYLVYKDNLPINAIRFKTGRYSGGRRIEDDFIDADWTFTYDENNLLQECVWHIHPDLEFRYSHCNEQFVYYTYEYDEQGLLRIYQRNEGLSLNGRKFSHAKRVIYDRLRNELLANYTISGKAWIPITKKRKNSIAFQFGGAPPTNLAIPVCKKCGSPLTFICLVELDKTFEKQPSLPAVPLFYCFDCLEPITSIDYQEIKRQLPSRVESDFFPKVLLQLGRSTDPENEEEALVKLGGLPNWIQDEEYPTCGKCGKLMMFVCQINSEEKLLSTHQSLMFGDSGRLYTFVCCDVVTSVMQCY